MNRHLRCALSILLNLCCDRSRISNYKVVYVVFRNYVRYMLSRTISSLVLILYLLMLLVLCRLLLLLVLLMSFILTYIDIILAVDEYFCTLFVINLILISNILNLNFIIS